MILINNGYISEINGFITIPKLPLYRSEEISLENIKENSYLIKTIFSYDNPEIFSNQLIYNAIPAFGTIYYISIPLFITGFLYGIVKCFKDIKNKEFNVNTIFIFWFISILICLLFIINPNVNKANAIYIPILYFICIGIYFIIDNFKLLIIPIILLFIINFGIFFNYYFYHYNEDSKDLYYFATDYIDAVSYSKDLGKNDVYIVGDLTAQQYIYLLLANQTSPYNFSYNDIKINDVTYHFDYNFNSESVYIMIYDRDTSKSWTQYGFKEKVFGKLVVFYIE